MEIDIKCKITNNSLFKHSCKNNSIEKTIKKAMKENANLRYANLRYANLYNANLRYANLSILKHISLLDHTLLSQILFNHAETRQQREWAGLIKISTDWCWEDFIKNMTKPAIKWCTDILSQWPEFRQTLEIYI